MASKYAYLANLLVISSTTTDLWPSIKKALHAHGINSRGSRLYQLAGDALFTSIANPFLQQSSLRLSRSNALAYLTLLGKCEIDLYPPAELVKSIQHWGLTRQDLSVIDPVFFRTLWRETTLQEFLHQNTDGTSTREIIETLVPIAQWYFLPGIANSLDKGITRSFKSLSEHYDQWRFEQTRLKIANNSIISEWDSIINRIDCQGYRFQALSSKEEMELESHEMQNCMQTYHEICQQTLTRAFTVSHIKTGKKVANLSVSETSPGHWDIDDLKGFENCDVTVDIEHAAFSVLRTFEDAFYKYPHLRKIMKKNRR